MKTFIHQRYTDQIAKTEEIREKFANREQYMPLIRLASFLLMLFLFYKYLISNELLYVYCSIALCLTFIFLSWVDHRLKLEILRCDRLILICENECKALDSDYSPFDPGDEFIDPEHSYSFDLDLFGKRSLFNNLNRSVTIFGKNRLADYLRQAYIFKDLIGVRQKSISELSENSEFRQQIQLVFYGVKSSENDRKELMDWLATGNSLFKGNLFTLLRVVLPLITISFLALAFAGTLPVQFFIGMIILQLLIVSAFGRKLVTAQSLLSNKVETISRYAQFLLLVEQCNFKTQYLIDLKKRLLHQGVEPPSKIMGKLFQLLNWMDSNLNILAAVFLNGLFMFNLHLIVAVEKWKSEYCDDIPRWFEVIGELDALCSLANFSANNPQFIFPVAVDDQFYFEASDLGHPLIPVNDCVTNNILISAWNQYCIITGANMSGKSTFLRSIGLNYVLAMVGAPVFATRFIFCPVILHSSIRTNDSLAKKESFFYAELKRLKEIISAMEGGQHTFILLDEILKGTNSRDKQAGSVALIEQLVKYHSVGLIATHDLVLGDLIKNYPDNIHNLCFEIQIVDDEMHIDYKLREGICQNLNATFLMRKMGILIDD